jgi:hypothetical protein
VNDSRRQTLLDVAVFFLLVAIGVAGRWGQPEWCFTPTAAAAVFAGRYFWRWAIAALVPVTILAVSDVLLPAYDSYGVMIATYLAMVVPVFLGKLLAGGRGGWSTAWRFGTCGVVPALVFFVVTNFAVWAFESDYAPTLAGLIQCYVAAVPFLRWMLAGDIFYMAVLFGCGALAGISLAAPSRLQPQPIAAR